MDKKGDRHYIIWKQQLCQSSYKARLKQKGGTLCLVGNSIICKDSQTESLFRKKRNKSMNEQY
ncbi:hypothetical protein DERF_011475 [Dermatophagoides farinae]|uniref:Uncharacterized protein n=1 Tax=Dermatophagoides farinae TaxID=6954 RepID=A0A922HW68_DERFA|nr:hypothetical protein DERF_011475 [Dermatophagoides farinae]